MAKFSHKLIVKYRFKNDTLQSNVVKLGHSREECETKQQAVIVELKALGHTIISNEIVQTQSTDGMASKIKNNS